LQQVREQKLRLPFCAPVSLRAGDRVTRQTAGTLKAGQMMKYLGSGEQLMNNTFVQNLVDAIFDALDTPQAIGRSVHITDGALVSKRDFISTWRRWPATNPAGAVPLGLARILTTASEKGSAQRHARAPSFSAPAFKSWDSISISVV